VQQIDWIGAPQRKPFKDINNTRESTAQEKARLALELGNICNTCPASIKSGGSINDVRNWKHARESAMKVAGNARSSVNELTAAINSMRRFT
jgi:hypothetical protein